MKSNLTDLISLYVRGKTSEKVSRNINMFLEAMRENDVNSFSDEKEELIFTTLCCDDLSRGQLRDFVVKHGKYTPPTREAFNALWTKLRSGGES